MAVTEVQQYKSQCCVYMFTYIHLDWIFSHKEVLFFLCVCFLTNMNQHFGFMFNMLKTTKTAYSTLGLEVKLTDFHIPAIAEVQLQEWWVTIKL